MKKSLYVFLLMILLAASAACDRVSPTGPSRVDTGHQAVDRPDTGEARTPTANGQPTGHQATPRP